MRSSYGRALEFGISIVPASAEIELARTLARRADELGLDLVGIQDHPYQWRFLDTWSLLADLLTGSFVVESIFNVPGIGVFLVNSSLNRDYSMVVGLVVLYAVLLLILNLLVDVSYSLLDPRVKYD